MTLRAPVAAVEGEDLVIRDERCVLVVRVREVVRFVKGDRMRWAAALRRGKMHLRAAATTRRQGGMRTECFTDGRASGGKGR